MALRYIRQALGAFVGTVVVHSCPSNKETVRHISASAVSNCRNIAGDIPNVLLDLDEDLQYPAHRLATRRSPALPGSTVASFVGLGLHRYLIHLNPRHMLFLSHSPPYTRHSSPKSSDRLFSAPLLVLDSPTELSVAAMDPHDGVSPSIHTQGHLPDLRLLSDPFLRDPALRALSGTSSAQVSPQCSSDTALSTVPPQTSVDVDTPQPKGRGESSSSQWVRVKAMDALPFPNPVSSTTSIVSVVPEWFSGPGRGTAGDEPILFERRFLDRPDSFPFRSDKSSNRIHAAIIATDTRVDDIPLGEQDLPAELDDSDSAESDDIASAPNSGLSYLSVQCEPPSRGRADGGHPVSGRSCSVWSRGNAAQHPMLLNDAQNMVQGSSTAPRAPQIVINIACCRAAAYHAAHEDEQRVSLGGHVEVRFQDTTGELQPMPIAHTRTSEPGCNACANRSRRTPAPVDPVFTVVHLRHEDVAEQSQPTENVVMLPERLPRVLSGRVSSGILQQPFNPTQAQSPTFLGLPPSIGPPPGLPPPPHRRAPPGLLGIRANPGGIMPALGPTNPRPMFPLKGRADDLLKRILQDPFPGGWPSMQPQNAFGVYDKAVGSPIGLGPRRLFDGNNMRRQGHAWGGQLPVQGALMAEFRSDEDEIVVPNDNQRKCQAPGAIGCPQGLPPPPPHKNIIELPPLDGLNLFGTSSLPADVPPPRVWHPPALTYEGRIWDQRALLSHGGVTFELTARILDGGLGRVVAGMHGGRLYAIKAIHKYRALKARHCPRRELIVEHDALKRVSEAGCVYLVNMLMSWEDEHVLYFVMPFCPMDMHTRIRTAPISPHDRLLYFGELIAGLHALHGLGIVHQDIKPGNILIDFQGRAMLSDFGLAAIIEGEYETWKSHLICGTGSYMAPEIVATDHSMVGHGPLVDVWSLGVTFLEMLGIPNIWDFEVEFGTGARAMHAQRLPLALDRIPADVGDMPRTLLPLMLQANPTKRIAVRDLHRHVPEDIWTQVISRSQSHDWRPDPMSAPRQPVERCLNFLSFYKAGHTLDTHRWWEGRYMSTEDIFRLEQASAQCSDFEYRAPGAFEGVGGTVV